MQTAYEIGFDTCWIHQERKMFEMGAGQQLVRDMDVQQQALGTDFLEEHKAVIDYPHSKLYLIIETVGENQVHH